MGNSRLLFFVTPPPHNASSTLLLEFHISDFCVSDDDDFSHEGGYGDDFAFSPFDEVSVEVSEPGFGSRCG
jgi:hypothetical protein